MITSTTLRICNAATVPVVPQGGMTGLAGTPVEVRQQEAADATADCLPRFAPGTKTLDVARTSAATPRKPTGQQPCSEGLQTYCNKK